MNALAEELNASLEGTVAYRLLADMKALSSPYSQFHY